MKPLNLISLGLVVIGGLNWGLVAFLDRDLVAAIFGTGTVLSRAVYAAVGLAALWQVIPLLAAIRGDDTAPLRRTSVH